MYDYSNHVSWGGRFPMKSNLKCMKDLEIFQALNEAEIAQVLQLARGKQYKKGESIFAEGDPADTIFLVKEGKVLLYKISEDGKELSLDILRENDIFGENSILEDNLQTMHAKALEDAFICTCTQKDFHSLMINPIVAFKVIIYLSEKLNNYTQQAAVMAFQDVKGRVLSTLSRLAKEYGELTPEGLKINITLSHQELANLVNASRVMVTNVLNELKHEGVIGVNQRIFYLCDLKQ